MSSVSLIFLIVSCFMTLKIITEIDFLTKRKHVWTEITAGQTIKFFCSLDFNHGSGRIPQPRRTHGRLYLLSDTNYVELKMSFMKKKNQF